jgi:hypothetical protein
MPALGHKRTFEVQNGMSALPPKADMCSALADVRLVPIADIVGATIMTIKSAGMTIGEIRGRSKPTHEKQDDDDDQDDANDTYATMTEAVAVATEAATEATKQENDEDDNENES